MKKIIILLIAVGSVSSLFAQSSSEEARRVILGQRKTSGSNDPKDVVLGNEDRRVYGDRDTRYPKDNRYGSRQERINEINRNHEAKVRSIRNNPHLSNSEKQRIIRDLNMQRERRINAINNGRNKYEDKENRYDDDYKKDKKYKYNKNNSGKKLGWEKGKGNPHKKNKYD